jgi:hypothetical protein
MISTEIAEAESIHKLEKIGHHWWVLLAGEDVSTARELIGLFRHHFKQKPNGPKGESVEEGLVEDDALEELRKPIERFWNSRRNHEARLLTGRDYEEFLKEQAKFPERIQDAIFDVTAPRTELLLIGGVKDKYSGERRLRLYKATAGGVTLCENFGAIGSGSTIAEAALMQRKHSELWKLTPTLYAVYEAQYLGRIAPGVGSELHMNVFRHSKTLKSTAFVVPNNQVFYRHMKALYKKFGLKPIDEKRLQMPDGSLFGLSED